MRSLVVYCFFYASLTFGVWTALLLAYFHHSHVSSQHKQAQEPSSVLSPGRKGSQQVLDITEPMLDPRERWLDRDRPKRRSILPPMRNLPFLADTNFNFSNPEHLDELSKYGFNAIVSRRLGGLREVPDTRDKTCYHKVYPVQVLTASVIICFHNEEFNALLRTVSSVLYLTPPYFLQEIILVDDKSEFADLQGKLEYHMEVLQRNIKLVRNTQREGLIRSRMIGAQHATGDVLVFLDSHCEVNQVWLEPLMAVIAENHHAVVCPSIDVIDAMTLEYRASPPARGAFDWGLRFRWDTVFSYEMDGPDGPNPIRSPAMAGGIFAIYKQYFYEIGQYDKGMELWGGENVEISLRIWLCGGQLLVIPCSRVGHVSKQHLETDPAIRKAMLRNSLRVAHVWLDEYKPPSRRGGPGASPGAEEQQTVGAPGAARDSPAPGQRGAT
ncbi:inactive polypeptide N-acetylgalactosaminyltransferase-like protein 5 [Perognathus longimembris pacificus]|uniref:inactive polypeptide N-acetylgalactosaminyltransferase-like protein 5 n=1 Tax=Perognathus longimembris pacificus TaxID=214514 RepID=UPI00201A21E4|nr:inactive polypeptide N-acetylgalactosaminyltransferase-like protein 5 [Perognathus longimembris pacificus]